MKKPIYAPLMAYLLSAVFFLFSQLAHSAEPVAMITDLKGSAHLSKKPSESIALLSYLPPGEEIILDANSQIVITYFAQSTEFSFKGPAKIEIKAQEAKASKGAAVVRQLDTGKTGAAIKLALNGKLTFATVEMRAMTLLKPSLISPVDTKIGTLSPTFKWKSLDDVEHYRLTLSDASDQALRQVDLANDTWTLPADVHLEYGASYHWKIEAFLKSGEKFSSQGKFSIASKDELSYVDSKRPAANSGVSDKVLFAIFLESENFNEDAKAIWQELAKQRPDDPNLKRRAR